MVDNRISEEAKLLDSLDMALHRWNHMQSSGNEHAEEAANAFEEQFYRFIDQLGEWFKSLPYRPSTLEEAELLAPLPHITELLPGPLQLNFLTELELLVDGIERVAEEKYD